MHGAQTGAGYKRRMHQDRPIKGAVVAEVGQKYIISRFWCYFEEQIFLSLYTKNLVC